MHPSDDEFQDLIRDGVDVCRSLWSTAFDATLNAAMITAGTVVMTGLVATAAGCAVGVAAFNRVARVFEVFGVRA